MERLTRREDGEIYIKCTDDRLDEADVILKALNKLADYEDAEESGLFVWLPSKPGDTVYWIEYITENGEVKGKIKSGTIWNYKYEDYLSVAIHTSKTKCIVLRAEFIYTSPEAAERALKERENGSGRV